ncbi:MAG: adenine methyltransferase [Anaerolineae bacterium]|nr:adenine methyltransferase [Anaerolineae bacterium]
MKVHYSSKSNEWATPQSLFDRLADMFGPFTLDPCATPENARCERFFTIDDDGLAQAWSGETVFMNPPYGRVIGRWIGKAYRESLGGATVVCLIPARSDTSYWHDYVMKADEIILLRGRIRFVGGTSCAPFPSAVVVFRPRLPGFGPQLSALDARPLR